MLNITTFLDANMRRLSKNVFCCPERETYYTSAEILSIASGLAEKLKERGIGKGDRVLIYLNNSPEYLFSYFAVWRIGAVAVPTNRVYTKFELDHMIQNAGVRLVITDEDGVDSFEESPFFSIFVPTGIEKMRKHPI